MSNGHVEHVFSTLKLIKSDHCNSLGEECLDDAVRIMVEGPLYPSGAIQLWWKDKQRSVGDVRKAPMTKQKKNGNESDDGCTPSSSVTLEEWDNFLADDDTDSHTDEDSDVCHEY